MREWTTGREVTVLNGPNGRMAYCFHAPDLHLVMGPPRHVMSIRFRVSMDGRPAGVAHGVDIDEEGHGTVVEPR